MPVSIHVADSFVSCVGACIIASSVLKLRKCLSLFYMWARRVLWALRLKINKTVKLICAHLSCTYGTLPADFAWEKLRSCCAAGTNGCLNLRRRAAAPDGRVRAEWSRCLGPMAWRPGDSVAPLRRSSAGWMHARIRRLSAGVGRRHPVTIRKASLMVGSIRWVWALRHQTCQLCVYDRISAYLQEVSGPTDWNKNVCYRTNSLFLGQIVIFAANLSAP